MSAGLGTVPVRTIPGASTASLATTARCERPRRPPEGLADEPGLALLDRAYGELAAGEGVDELPRRFLAYGSARQAAAADAAGILAAFPVPPGAA